MLKGLPISLRHLTLDGGTGNHKFYSGLPPAGMQLARLTRLTSLTLRNFTWCAPPEVCDGVDSLMKLLQGCNNMCMFATTVDVRALAAMENCIYSLDSDAICSS